MPVPGPLELVLILVIVAMLFGVGKLPEVFGSVGKGIREFRKQSSLDEEPSAEEKVEAPQAEPAKATQAEAPAAPAESVNNGQSA